MSKRFDRPLAGWIALLALLALTTLAYAPGLHGGWVLDDFANIVDNPWVHLTFAAGPPDWWHAAMSSTAGGIFHRPLAMLTFAFSWALAPGSAPAMKVANLGIHLLNGVLVYVLLLGILAWVPRKRRPSRYFAVLLAGAWLLAPINLLPVLYVVQRMQSLATVFVFAGIALYLYGRKVAMVAQARHGAGWQRRARRGHALAWLALLLCTGLGLAAKESAAPLPLYAFLAEWVLVAPVARRQATGQWPVRLLFGVALWLPMVVGLAWLLPHVLSASAYAGRDFTLGQRLLTEPRIIVGYATDTLVPRLRDLSLYHDDILVSTGWLSPPATLGAILALLGVLGLAIATVRRRPLLALGLAWFLAAEVMTGTIIPLELAYEQRMYFASLGLLLAASSLVWPWRAGGGAGRGRPLPLGAIALGLAVFCFAVGTHLRARTWESPMRLAQTEVAMHPTSPRANYELGRLYYGMAAQAGRKERLPLQLKSLRYLLISAHAPGASILPWQGIILLLDSPGPRNPHDAKAWAAIDRHLARHALSAEDTTALLALTRCTLLRTCATRPSDVLAALDIAAAKAHPAKDLLAARQLMQVQASLTAKPVMQVR